MQNRSTNQVCIIKQRAYHMVEVVPVTSGTDFGCWRWVVYGGQVGVARGVGQDGTPSSFCAINTYDLTLEEEALSYFLLMPPVELTEAIPPFTLKAEPQSVFVSGIRGPMEIVHYLGVILDVTLSGPVLGPDICFRRFRDREVDAIRESDRQTQLHTLRSQLQNMTGRQLAQHMRHWGKFSRTPVVQDQEFTPTSEQVLIARSALASWARKSRFNMSLVMESIGPYLTRLIRELLDYYNTHLRPRGKAADEAPVIKALQRFVQDGAHPLTSEMVRRILNALRSHGRLPRGLGNKLGEHMDEVVEALSSCLPKPVPPRKRKAPKAGAEAPRAKQEKVRRHVSDNGRVSVRSSRHSSAAANRH